MVAPRHTAEPKIRRLNISFDNDRIDAANSGGLGGAIPHGYYRALLRRHGGDDLLCLDRIRIFVIHLGCDPHVGRIAAPGNAWAI
jgi:hypothetical protein